MPISQPKLTFAAQLEGGAVLLQNAVLQLGKIGSAPTEREVNIAIKACELAQNCLEFLVPMLRAKRREVRNAKSKR